MIDPKMLELVKSQAEEVEALAKKQKDPAMLKMAVGATLLVDMVADLDKRMHALEEGKVESDAADARYNRR